MDKAKAKAGYCRLKKKIKDTFELVNLLEPEKTQQLKSFMQ